jgi:hypothetical protein
MFKSRLDSLEFERENGYRHPPLYIIHDSDYSGARGESKQRICEENPCTDVFELIEESL